MQGGGLHTVIGTKESPGWHVHCVHLAQMPLPSRCRTPACVDCAAGGAATGPGQEVRAKKAAPSGGQGGKPQSGRICKCTGRAAAPRGLASRS